MPRKDLLIRLHAIADRISKIEPKRNAEIAILNLMTGAVFATYQAAKLDYDDDRANPNPDESKREFKRSAIGISRGKSPHRAWCAGFYMNSALLRIAPINERINKHTHTVHDIPKIRQLVNKIKHEPDAQIGRAWHIKLIDVVDALELLCKRLEDLPLKE
ncbi:hypothetical protein MELA_01279 [Candidatus Methylomirabilis lanthanidiphila]|uniref:Uncharacterized protein n=1 Tax=Candidatus Methylomirabilis lanthanidiphila TaxID=2211376 RepID=A0A564ZHY9_9BACT|nr:hypothetical protein [Sulfuricella denitrificans]VUZ84904.1 hypothetical protein MELA_01279 [Candidatus Methylomirabilis lanthanidiphila]